MVKVDGHRDAVGLGEGVEVNDGYGVFVVRGHIAAGIDDVELVSDDGEFVGVDGEFVRLKAHKTTVKDFEGGGIYLGDVPALLVIGVDLDRAGVGGDVGILSLETDIAAVGDVNLPDVDGSAGVHDLHFVGAVDHGVDLAAVDLDVITDVTKLLGHGGIGNAIDVAAVFAGGEVIVVKGGFVAAHVAFIEQVETVDKGRVFGGELLHFGYEDGYVFAAGEQAGNEEAKSSPHAECRVLCHSSIFRISL
jgi:hypothetical protein